MNTYLGLLCASFLNYFSHGDYEISTRVNMNDYSAVANESSVIIQNN